jgi:hypothetical protein
MLLDRAIEKVREVNLADVFAQVRDKFRNGLFCIRFGLVPHRRFDKGQAWIERGFRGHRLNEFGTCPHLRIGIAVIENTPT